MHSQVAIRNNIRSFGEGSQVMLFAHGFGCDQNIWRHITPAFEKDYRIILFDYVGAGKSDTDSYNKERYSSLHGYAKDILDICETMELHNIIFVGHSVSAMIGLLAALERPDYFQSIIMIGPSARYINDHDYVGGFERSDIDGLIETMEKNYIGWANFLGPAIVGNSERPELAQELTDSICSTDPVIAGQFARVTFFGDNRSDLTKLKIPCLILQCSDDIIAPLGVGQYVHEHLKQSEYKVMKAKGHCPHLSEPQETISLIKEYLDSRKNA